MSSALAVLLLAAVCAAAAASSSSLRGSVVVDADGSMRLVQQGQQQLQQGRFGDRDAAQIVYNSTYNSSGWYRENSVARNLASRLPGSKP